MTVKPNSELMESETFGQLIRKTKQNIINHLPCPVFSTFGFVGLSPLSPETSKAEGVRNSFKLSNCKEGSHQGHSPP
jgi:hypothetical protein